MAKVNRVEARIFGSEYVITGEASEEYILSITFYVDKKMRELAKSFPTASPEKIAVLAAINIADELFQYKEASSHASHELVSTYEAKAKKLISMIDRKLIGE